MQFLNPRNSIAGLLPATFLYKIEECVLKVLSKGNTLDGPVDVCFAVQFCLWFNFSIIHVGINFYFLSFPLEHHYLKHSN